MKRLATLAGLLLVASGCSSCPPEWADEAPMEDTAHDDGYRYAAASVGELSVHLDAINLALTRATRRLADALGLDVEGRLSVVRAGGLLFVEARSSAASGNTVISELDGLELVELRNCDSRTYARVRLAVGG
ncbi:MAG: hypothetical protein ACI9EF_003867 [Pseudohongiellaceae bacterium]|jgi:hypothetical protein